MGRIVYHLGVNIALDNGTTQLLNDFQDLSRVRAIQTQISRNHHLIYCWLL
jgi:hypothetical protein